MRSKVAIVLVLWAATASADPTSVSGGSGGGGGTVPLGSGTSGNYVETLTAGVGLTGDCASEGCDGTIATASTEAGFISSDPITCGANTAGRMSNGNPTLSFCDNAGTPILHSLALGQTDGAALAIDAETTCTQLTCSGPIESTDQNPSAANKLQIRKNESGTPTVTCAGAGASNRYTILDQNTADAPGMPGICDETSETGGGFAVSSTYVILPNGGTGIGGSGGAVLASNNQMRCASFTAPMGITAATKLGTRVATGAASGDCALCLYNAGGTTLLAEANFTCTASNAIASETGLPAFNLVAGVKYRYCWTADNTTVTFYGAGTIAGTLANAFVTNVGDAANASTGTGPVVCPATTGALSVGASVDLIAGIVSAE